jgi:transcriptional regulator PpsR
VPKESLGDLDAEVAATLIAATADIALVLDLDGVVRDASFGSPDLASEHRSAWIGKPWVDTVTVESKPKIQELLREAIAGTTPRSRQVNHHSADGADLPILYSAMRVREGRIVAVGRDLRATAALQQRLVEAQQSIERDYSRLRRVETRYRLLFQMSSEAILIVDSASQMVLEANPAASRLFGEAKIVGRSFLEGFDTESVPAVQALLAGVRAAGRTNEVRAQLAEGRREFVVSASLFRQDRTALFLLHLSPVSSHASVAVVPKTKSKLLELVELAPDGFVVTDGEGKVITANAAFLDLAQVATEEQAVGQSLERWLDRPVIDLNLLTSSLREHGSVRLFATNLRGEFGGMSEVEISGVAVATADQPCFGFTIRNVGRRLPQEPASGRPLSRSAKQLTELVGRVPLKDLVRETTDVIERLCIEAALELTGDNRASAADMLGLSRQSLYVKLRRYGLGDLAATPED